MIKYIFGTIISRFVSLAMLLYLGTKVSIIYVVITNFSLHNRLSYFSMIKEIGKSDYFPNCAVWTFLVPKAAISRIVKIAWVSSFSLIYGDYLYSSAAYY